MRERFQATCVGVDSPDNKLFDTWSLSLKSLRWEAIEEFTRELLLLEVPLRSYWSKDKFLKGMSGTRHRASKESSSDFVGMSVSVQAIDQYIQDSSFWASVAVVQDVSFAAEFVGRWAEGCSCCEDELVTGRTAKRRRTKWLNHVNETTPCPFRGCRATEIAAGDWLPKLQSILADKQRTLSDSVSKAVGPDRQLLLNDWIRSRSKLWGQLRVKLAYFNQLPWKLCAFVYGLFCHSSNSSIE